MNSTFLYITFQWPEWWMLSALVLLLCVQFFALFKQKNLGKKRRSIKVLLNLLTWIVIFLFAIRPSWTRTDPSKGILVLSDNVNSSKAKKVKDSLKLSQTLSYSDFKRHISEDPDFTAHLRNIFLLGQDFNSEILARLSDKQVSWMPAFNRDELQEVQWKSVLRRGDRQEVSGKIEVSESKILNLRYGSQVLDSVILQKGFNHFKLSFPAFANGRTIAALHLEDKKLQDIPFFGVNKPALSVLFILENPDFESKTLAEWLGKNGHRVEISTKVAKNTQNRAVINKNEAVFIPDLIITSPGNTNNPLVKKAMAESRNVLFFSLTKPAGASKTINQALGTRWQLKKISNEESIHVGKNLTAIPYQFEPSLNQKKLPDYPVAIQKMTGKVGLSLLNETFPLKLSGDSLTYDKVWYSILAALDPAFKDHFEINAPVIRDTRTAIILNNPSVASSSLHLAGDTIMTNPSSINPLTRQANFIFRNEGWQTLADSLEIFVESPQSSHSKAKLIEDALESRPAYVETIPGNKIQSITHTLPDWLWFLLIVLSLAALWVESKLGY